MSPPDSVTLRAPWLIHYVYINIYRWKTSGNFIVKDMKEALQSPDSIQECYLPWMTVPLLTCKGQISTGSITRMLCFPVCVFFYKFLEKVIHSSILGSHFCRRSYGWYLCKAFSSLMPLCGCFTQKSISVVEKNMCRFSNDDSYVGEVIIGKIINQHKESQGLDFMGTWVPKWMSLDGLASISLSFLNCEIQI